MASRAVTLMTSVAFVFGIAGQVQAQSLKETFVAAYKNSRLLEQNRALLRATDESAAIALAALRPVVSFVASANASEPIGPSGDRLTANASLSAQLLIYDGGNAQLGIEVAKQSILSTRQALRNLEQQVLLNAASAFFNLRKAAEFVALQTNNLQLIERELQGAKDRFDVGEVTRTDVALAEARLAAVKSSLAAAEGGLARAREGFRVAVGKYPGRLGAAGGLPRAASTIGAAKGVAMKSSPAIVQAQHDAKIADLNVERATKAFGPTISLSGSINADQDLDTSANVAVSLNQTLYSGGVRNALHRQAIAQKEAARAALLQTTLLAEQGVGNAWADLQVSRASLVASAEQIRAAELAFEGLREEAALGARTTLDVLDAEQNLLDATTNRAASVNDQFIAAYGLLAAMGKLTVDQLNLGIVTYDPAAYYESIKDAPRQSGRGLQLDKVLEAIGRK